MDDIVQGIPVEGNLVADWHNNLYLVMGYTDIKHIVCLKLGGFLVDAGHIVNPDAVFLYCNSMIEYLTSHKLSDTRSAFCVLELSIKRITNSGAVGTVKEAMGVIRDWSYSNMKKARLWYTKNMFGTSAISMSELKNYDELLSEEHQSRRQKANTRAQDKRNGVIISKENIQVGAVYKSYTDSFFYMMYLGKDEEDGTYVFRRINEVNVGRMVDSISEGVEIDVGGSIKAVKSFPSLYSTNAIGRLLTLSDFNQSNRESLTRVLDVHKLAKF